MASFCSCNDHHCGGGHPVPARPQPTTRNPEGREEAEEEEEEAVFELPATENENENGKKRLSIQGVAQLCFVYVGEQSCIQGHFIDLTNRQCYGVMATETLPPASEEMNCCCCLGDDKPVWYSLRLLQFQTGKVFVDVVSKKGGDYATLSSPHISFTTDRLKTDEAAKEEVLRSGKYGLSADNVKENVDLCLCTGSFALYGAKFREEAEEEGSHKDKENQTERRREEEKLAEEEERMMVTRTHEVSTGTGWMRKLRS
ncbi:hypothetical protein QOT17_010528 [Balamuthia mandrillaris]